VIPDLETASHVWSGLSSVESRGAAVGAQRPCDLAALEFTLLDGQVAVAENGAVWNVPSDSLERSAALLAEHLVLVVPQHGIVADLHDAYARLEPSATVFGWFLAGPSKTADIEQALVHGAHGPRQLTLVVSAC
jgi:L-lactate dehydrogenase complex protein LldG